MVIKLIYDVVMLLTSRTESFTTRVNELCVSNNAGGLLVTDAVVLGTAALPMLSV